ncbi:hypothetical protein OQ279_10510 [Salinimicrobium sp. MT39]|uniref:Uncharacterized protein n=1 Tax=Salinimicrobium profundisediminis TaxID=2994553 RepID=A0A9X3CXH8_9FLAO|nr:DUF6730 family protein [Salinimicrobium profundisediminis]MCX2838586.1 hypothetical protein [Salinimicrobium profundisediminis]
MKKIDEIMELMTDEIQDFQVALLQMKKMTDELNTRSIPISTEVMEKQLKFFFQQQQEKEALMADKLVAIDKKLKKAYILPKSMGILFGSVLVLLISIICYMGLQLESLKDDKNDVYPAYQYGEYLKENPGSREAYENWLQNHNIP